MKIKLPKFRKKEKENRKKIKKNNKLKVKLMKIVKNNKDNLVKTLNIRKGKKIKKVKPLKKKMKIKVAIIDYGAGNIQSVKNALDYLNVDSVITKDPDVIKKANKVIFPGVGSFGYVMDNLRKNELDVTIKDVINSGTPFLGICIGLQVLFEKSEESPGVKGLGIFKGEVVKFTKGKIPQIGWNKVMPKQKFSLMKKGYAYFVNSYYVVPKDKKLRASVTDYYGDFTSAIRCENVFAVQFHPEKSGNYGLDLLRSWVKC